MEDERFDTENLARIVNRNIKALTQRREAEEKKKNTEERIADSITKFTGSMLFVYIHLIIFGVWIIWNSGLIDVKPFDESFVVLAMFASVEAIFLSTFVLISQNRMNVQADKRAELSLQVTLLAEHEITRLVTITSAIAKKLELDIPEDAEELERDVRPEDVLDTLDEFDPKIDTSKKH
ncbi:MAG TPA: DUF1003 domain-containing protein [Flavobacterium sp.]|nr:DUF1003 domain-containing protein [Flavobacterium sp.]